MTPPLRAASADLIYDLGEYAIVDNNHNQRFDPKVDRVEFGRDHEISETDGVPSPRDLAAYLEKLGLRLDPGMKLGRATYQANFARAKSWAAAGNLPKTRESMDKAVRYWPRGEAFEQRKSWHHLIRLRSVDAFLKISEGDQARQVPAFREEDLRLLRQYTRNEAREWPIRDGFHRLIFDRELDRAETAAKHCATVEFSLSLLWAMEISHELGLPVDAERIEKLQGEMSRPECSVLGKEIP